ncbi:MAG: DUF1800 family protein, partial [Acidobacteriota bacterium]
MHRIRTGLGRARPRARGVEPGAATSFFDRLRAGSLARLSLPLAAALLAPAPPVMAGDAFFTVPPCRVIDTRQAVGPYGGPVLAAGATGAVAIGGQCGISTAATAVSLNVTVVAPTADGYLTLYPAGSPPPVASTINYKASQVRANNAILRLGAGSAVSVFAGQGTGTVHFLIDVNGYFDPTGNAQPVVGAGPDQAIPGATASLAGTASDDGVPAPLTYSWVVVSGPGAVLFGSSGALSTTATFSASGVYVLRLTASDSQASSSDEVAVAASSSSRDAVRLLEQSAFGPTNALLAHVQSIGPAAWIDEQLAAPISGYPSLPLQPSTVPPTCDSICVRDNYTMYPLQRQFFTNALYGGDQLRQRVAFALHELLVISGRDISQPSWMAPYLQVLDAHAFGSFRQLLYDITLNPGM